MLGSVGSSSNQSTCLPCSAVNTRCRDLSRDPSGRPPRCSHRSTDLLLEVVVFVFCCFLCPPLLLALRDSASGETAHAGLFFFYVYFSVFFKNKVKVTI